MLSPPKTPLEAVTHPDPGPYYAHLATDTPFYFDTKLQSWVASSAAAVTEVLGSDLCRVRPPSEPIPAALFGSSAATLFGTLVRMTDEASHAVLKKSVSRALEGRDSSRWSAHWAGVLLPLEGWQTLPWTLPSYVMGSLLGVAETDLAQMPKLLKKLAYCFSPRSGPNELERGKQAAAELLTRLEVLLLEPQGLLASLERELAAQGRAVLVANAVGLLWQAFEATAGLLASGLLRLSQNPELRTTLKTNPTQITDFSLEVLRTHSPIQNTRSYVARAGVLAGQRVQAGDAVLLLLAAANLDSRVNPDPLCFELGRRNRTLFTFGIGPHTCPGQVLALSIAGAGLLECLRSRIDFLEVQQGLTYRTSVNARLPVWTEVSS